MGSEFALVPFGKIALMFTAHSGFAGDFNKAMEIQGLWIAVIVY